MTGHFSDTKTLPYSAEQIFNLVADVGSYPAFLPWCLAARVHQQTPTLLIADLIVGYKAFREKYTSRVILDAPTKISVTLEEGPLTFLKTQWSFKDLDASKSCQTTLDLSFEFRSKIKQTLMTSLFDEAAKKMMTAFETRAKNLY